MWGSYGEADGFTESQWDNTEANVGPNNRWGIGIGFAYGGFLPGLMQEQTFVLPQAPSDPHIHEHVEDPDKVDEVGITTAIGKWPWYTAASIFLAAALVGWLVWYRKKNGGSRRG